jgi:hypothetical protein
VVRRVTSLAMSAQTYPVASHDPVAAAHAAKDTAAVLREARSRLRRVEKVAVAAAGIADPETQSRASTAREAVEQLVDHLIRLERIQQRRAQEALRRAR